MSERVMDGHPVTRFRLYVTSTGRLYEFFTLTGVRHYLRNLREEGVNTDYYSIFDKHTNEYVETQAGRTE